MVRRKTESRPREAKFQFELAFRLREFLQANPEVNGITFEQVQIEFPAPPGQADIVVLQPGQKPFLVIETKRKNGRIEPDIDPLSPAVTGQAIKYAVQLGAPYFATANPDYIAVFRLPPRGERFQIEKHRVFLEAISAVNAELAQRVIERVTLFDRSAEADRAQIATGMDWTFVIRIRSFVDWLARRIFPAIMVELEENEGFASRVEALRRETGASLEGVQLARETAYVLTNKIVFYKVLERHYGQLTRLSVEGVKNAKGLVEHLQEAFIHATEVTTDFEAIFNTRVFDELVFSTRSHDLTDLLEGVGGFIDDMTSYRLETLEADVIGHVYEALLPEEERHVLGQFYTPPAVAELLTRWAVRSADDIVLDPAVGSGTFLVKAYQRLRSMKAAQGLRATPGARHKELLGQLYGVDINPFPAQLTAMNLAMRDVRNPVTEMNVIEKDFFQLTPGAPAYVPYSIRTPDGDKVRQIVVPHANAVVANPPYTRWTELSDASKDAINGRLGSELGAYGLRAIVRGGIETALYQHYVICAHQWLKSAGRCGMIISNSWLQTDVGVKFAGFILDHYKIQAVVDLGPRIFPIPLVGANLLLLEKCNDEKERLATQSVFAYVDKEMTVQDYWNLIDEPASMRDRVPRVRVVSQAALPRNKKWIGVLFGIDTIEEKIAGRTVLASALFDGMRGTLQYCAEESRGLGANRFFFMDKRRASQIGIPSKYLVQTLPSSRDAPNFTINEQDWRALRKDDREVYILHPHAERGSLPNEVQAYIKWGETDCRNRDGRICSQSTSCKERAADSRYFGWFDLGEVLDAKLFVPRYNTYVPRFVMMEKRLALSDDYICLSPKEKMTQARVKAMAAVLNSSLSHVQLELLSRQTGGGALGVEVAHAGSVRVPDIRDISKVHVTSLGVAFDALESKARIIGGANTAKSFEQLAPSFRKIDAIVAKLVGLSKRDMDNVREASLPLRQRRTIRAPEPRPEFIKGLSPLMKRRPARKKRPRVKKTPSRRLDEFHG